MSRGTRPGTHGVGRTLLLVRIGVVGGVVRVVSGEVVVVHEVTVGCHLIAAAETEVAFGTVSLLLSTSVMGERLLIASVCKLLLFTGETFKLSKQLYFAY